MYVRARVPPPYPRAGEVVRVRVAAVGTQQRPRLRPGEPAFAFARSNFVVVVGGARVRARERHAEAGATELAHRNTVSLCLFLLFVFLVCLFCFGMLLFYIFSGKSSLDFFYRRDLERRYMYEHSCVCVRMYIKHTPT